MCFDIGSRHLGCWGQNTSPYPKAVTYHEQPHYCRFMIGHSLGRMESRIKKFTPHCICRPKTIRDLLKRCFDANYQARPKFRDIKGMLDSTEWNQKLEDDFQQIQLSWEVEDSASISALDKLQKFVFQIVEHNYTEIFRDQGFKKKEDLDIFTEEELISQGFLPVWCINCLPRGAVPLLLWWRRLWVRRCASVPVVQVEAGSTSCYAY